MNVYPVRIDWNGEDALISLKLDLRHIRELQAKTGKDILDLLTDAPLTLAPMGDLLEAALRWKGNENPADLTGEDLFDLLVQQGRAGVADWMELANGIAAASGVLQSQQASAMIKSARRKMEEAIERLEKGDEESEEESEEAPADPSPATGE
jgi:hypothetical protein